MVVIVVIVALGLAAFWAVNYRSSVGSQVPVLLARTNLPAYHVLTSNDVTLGVRPAGAGVSYPSFPIDGRLTLKAIKEGQPITNPDVSPNITGWLGPGLLITGLEEPQTAVLGGALSNGERVWLVLTSGGHHLVSLRAAVLSVSANDHNNSSLLVVALNATDGQKYGWLLAKSDVLILLNPAA